MRDRQEVRDRQEARDRHTTHNMLLRAPPPLLQCLPLIIATFLLLLLSAVSGFKTGLEEGLICNVCVGTHPGQQSINNFVFSTRLIHMFLFPIPGCGLYDFDYRWYWGKICPRCLFYIYYEHIFVCWICKILLQY